MGIFRSTIFEGMRKSVGNVTTYMDGDRQVVRGKVAFRKDRGSEAQLRQRGRMRVTRDAWLYFSRIGTECFCTASGRTAWNRFVKANIMGEAAGRGLEHAADWLGVLVADGPLAVPVMSAEIDGERREVTFRWRRQPDRPGCVGTDRLYGVIADLGKWGSVLVDLGTRGSDGEKTVALPKSAPGKWLAVYGFAKNAAGTRTSESVGLAWREEGTDPETRNR